MMLHHALQCCIYLVGQVGKVSFRTKLHAGAKQIGVIVADCGCFSLGGVATLCTRNGLMDAAPSDACVMRRTTNRVSDVVIESYRCAHIDNMLIY